ncbi:hypothetical protein [Niabella hibiscisoli]|uniref:hypothetical protein n=1 Tax=Niabella hibiscisoli TaxID=1825928 RepID=UPI001F105E55|nr:hypothetical protein [Niabella hibiscisoli]MCH5719783.1 hypothetical protein [Niabella hibiscisoli]
MAQDTIRFKKALAVQSGSRYGREAIYTDQLSYRLLNGALSPRAANYLTLQQEATPFTGEK